MYVCVFVCVSIYLSIHPWIYISIYLSIHLSIYLSMYGCMYIYIYIYVCTYVRMYVTRALQFGNSLGRRTSSIMILLTRPCQNGPFHEGGTRQHLRKYAAWFQEGPRKAQTYVALCAHRPRLLCKAAFEHLLHPESLHIPTPPLLNPWFYRLLSRFTATLRFS